MTKIRIESNPYQNNISYSRFDEKQKTFIPITKEESTSSKLLSDDFKQCFFPFKAKEILCQIIKEYDDNLEIVFEGSSDEYNELLDVIKTSDRFNNIIISQGTKYLENGQFVIKQINDIFKHIKPIIEDSVSNENKTLNICLKKYSDASNDIIPICVIGNTNMGKSTFINALLGAEYLPQDKDRCTVKIYKISKSQQDDTVRINFQYNGSTISVFFDSGFKIDGDVPSEFNDVILKSLTEVLPKRVSIFLKYLNSYDEKRDSQVISNNIEVIVPFKSDVLDNAENPFVIFDTPGSNYAGNESDLELLKEQMKNMTNGLPIFITDYSGLQTNDSFSLIKELQSLDELDQRFTILIVNKADEIPLDKDKWEEEKKRVKYAPIPIKLANRGLQGIYFVSSIMGLGYKNDGCFLDKLDKRTFKKNLSEFDGEDDDDDDFVKDLYTFNILPEQIKKKFEDELSEDIDQIYLNSGLYSVEKEFETYANIYSAYNKCQQSWIFLQKVVSETTDEIENQKIRIQIEIDNWNSKFSEKQRELIVELQNKVEEKKSLFRQIRNEQIQKCIGESVVYFDHDDLKIIEEKIYQKQEKVHDVEGSRIDKKKAEQKTSKELTENFTEVKENFVSIFTGDKSLSESGTLFINNFSKMIINFGKNIKNVNSIKTDLENKINNAEKASYDEALKSFEDKYSKKASTIQDEIYDNSKNYWLSSSDELKQDLIGIVAMSNALTDDHKKLLTEEIANYQKLELEKQDISDPKKTKYRSLISNRINVMKLESNFNHLMKDSIVKLHNDTQNIHCQIFESWSDKLLDVIRQNIGELNPELIECQDNIDKRRIRKEQLEQNLSDLKKYYQDISKMISWKE